MYLSPRVARLFPESQRGRLHAWFATHPWEQAAVGMAMGGLGATVGQGWLTASSFTVGILAGKFVQYRLEGDIKPWTLPHEVFHHTCAYAELELNKAGVHKPERYRLHALNQWHDLYKAIAGHPHAQWSIYPLGSSVMDLLTPESVHQTQLTEGWTLETFREQMRAAYWLALERNIVSRVDYRVGAVDFVLPHIQTNPFALLMEAHHLNQDVAYWLMRSPGTTNDKGALDVGQGEQPDTHWATDGVLRVNNHLGDGSHPLWDRYPSFRPIGLSMGAIYGTDVALDPKEMYRLLNSVAPARLDIPPDMDLGSL